MPPQHSIVGARNTVDAHFSGLGGDGKGTAFQLLCPTYLSLILCITNCEKAVYLRGIPILPRICHSNSNSAL